MHVFTDPLHLTRQDRIEDGEIRYQTIGQIYGVLLRLGDHKMAEEESGEIEWIRIISARRSAKAEGRRYETEED